jgi:hypothetical protein
MSIKKKIGLSFFKKKLKIIAKNCGNFLEKKRQLFKKVGINLIITPPPSMTKKLGKIP